MATKGNKRDRDKLKKRVKAALGDAGMTQKDFEDAHDLSTGTLTRVFGGRRNVDRELLDALASALSVDAAELVSGTSFTEVLEDEAAAAPAPSKPASKPKPAADKSEPAASEPKATRSAPAASAPKANKPAPAASKPGEAKAEAKAKAKPAPEPVREPKADAPKPAGSSKASGPTPAEPPPSEAAERKRFLPFRILKSIKDLVFGD